MTRRVVRIALTAVIILSLAVVGHGALNGPPTASAADTPRANPTPNATVVTESGQHGTLIAWDGDGDLLTYRDDHTKYYDVDPVPNTSWTVEYAAADTIHTSRPSCRSPPCTRNVIERLNLSTGRTTEIYARQDPAEWGAEWHDHVRIDDQRIVVADIVHDQVFLVNTTTDLVTWRWDAQTDFDLESGGQYPRDWTHINDVERLADGRILVSLRNHDQVVFLDPETGLQANWTLGADGDHDTLHEQHNPDYIPPARGGPALLVADSENGRLVEYSRTDDTWERAWQWRDDLLAWPRDADRLPSGNTLAVDTHGGRVLEIAPNGSVVWSVTASHPYDAERLGTGPESATGESADRLGLRSRRPAGEYSNAQPLEAVARQFAGVVPARYATAAVYLTPVWVGRRELVAILLGATAAVAWLGAEAWWRLPGVRLRLPIDRRRE